MHTIRRKVLIELFHVINSDGKKLKLNDVVTRGSSYTIRPIRVQKQLAEGNFQTKCYWHGSINQLENVFIFQFQIKFQKKFDLKSFEVIKITRVKEKKRLFYVRFQITCDVAKLLLCNDWVLINNKRAFIREA